MTQPMTDQEWLAERFETHRPHLRGVAYRMLGSLSEADDAVQEAWIRLSRTRHQRRREPARLADHGRRPRVPEPAPLAPDPARGAARGARPGPDRRPASRACDPEHEALLGDSIGLALLAVLETLSPAERVAFVLHDVFAVPFDDIAPIVGRSTAATRQLASRGRRRVQGAPVPDTDLDGQWAVVDAFLAASRDGDFERLLAVLDPGGRPPLRRRRRARPRLGQLVRGREAVATNAMVFRNLAATATRTLVNGVPGGVVWAPDGRPFAVLSFTVARWPDRRPSTSSPTPSGSRAWTWSAAGG